MLGNRDLPETRGHFVILVSYDGAFADVGYLPRLWLFPAAELQPLVKVAAGQGMRLVSRRAILAGAAEYENAWHLLQQL